MTTTVRLLATYDGSPPQTLRDLPDALATSFVAAGNASLDLTGGVRRYQGAATLSRASVPTLVGATTLQANQRTEIDLPEGSVLTVIGSTGATGTVQRLNTAGAEVQSWPLGAIALFGLGPYVGVQRFTIACDNGSADVRAASGKPTSQRQKSNMVSEGAPVYLAAPVVVGANPYNELLQLTLPTDADAAEITILNADNMPVTGIKVSVGYGSTLGAATGTLGLASSGLPIDGAFTACTQNGSSTGSLTAAGAVSTGPSGANIGGADCGSGTWDLTFCPTVARVDGNDRDKPVMYVSITWPIGSKRTFSEMDGTTSVGWQNEGSQAARVAPFGFPRRCMVVANSAADVQSNPAFYLISNGQAARSHTQFPAVIIRFSVRGGLGETNVDYGDSLAAGTSADIQYCGRGAELRALLTTPKNPVGLVNLAVPGTDVTRWVSRVRTTIGLFARANVIVPCGSVNSLGSPITQTGMNLVRRDFAGIRKLLDRPGIFMVTATVPAAGVTWKQFGTSDSLRLASNTYYKASGFPCLPLAEAIAGPQAAVPSGPQAGQTQQTIAPIYTVDGLHPYSPGYRKQGEDSYPIWVTL